MEAAMGKEATGRGKGQGNVVESLSVKSKEGR
jgi:hypothetical protein